MIKRQSHNEESCWWCNGLADSQEHRHKKSDVKNIFGSGFESEPVIIKDHHQKSVQGPNSKLLKFPKVLCQDCNNSRSQPFDRAYDLFISYVLNNYHNILSKGLLDFNDIVQVDVENFKQNVFRYYTKAFCCRLAANNISIEPKLIDFLNGIEPLNFLYFKFEVRPDIYSFLTRPDSDANEGNIYLSPLRYFQSEENNKIDLVYQFYNLQWLRTYTFYSERMTEKIYAGYNEYNEANTVQLEAKYSVNPEKLFEVDSNIETRERDDDDWLKEYLNINIFKNQAQ